MNEKMEFDVIINGKKARAELKNIEGDTKKLETSAVESNKNMSESWVSLGLKITAATVAMKASISAYEQQYKAEVSLGAAMKNNIALQDTNIANWKEYASAVQEWANIGDEVTLQQLAFLNTLGLSDEQMKAIIQTAAEVTNAGFMPFDSAVRNLGKSLSGMSGELGELFPQLRDLTAEQLKAGEGVAVIAEAVKGQSAAIANSPVGKWNALWNTAGDTFEKVGEKILGILDSIHLLDFASTVFEQMSFGMDLLGLRFEWMGEKVKQFWNVLTFDTKEANKAQQRAVEITKEYNEVLKKSKDALEDKKEAIEEDTVALDLQTDATRKALDEEMKKIYADELAAAGVDELGDEIENTNQILRSSESYYEGSSRAAIEYASAVKEVTRALEDQMGIGTNQVTEYSTVSSADQAYWDSLNPFADLTGTTFDAGYGMGTTATNGWASGGYTGDIGTSDVAGVVHGQEYVVNAKTTKDLGLNGSGGAFQSMDAKLDMLSTLPDLVSTMNKILYLQKQQYAIASSGV